MPLRVGRGAPVPASEAVGMPGGDGFRAGAESFARMVRLGPRHWNGATEAESLDTAPALQATAAGERTGAWVEVSAFGYSERLTLVQVLRKAV